MKQAQRNSNKTMNLDFWDFEYFWSLGLFCAQNIAKFSKMTKIGPKQPQKSMKILKTQKSKFIVLLELLLACYMQILKEIGKAGKKP